MTDYRETGTEVVVAVDLAALARNWRAFVTRGAIAIGLGVLALLLPTGAAMGLTLLFGAFALADGVLSLWSGIARMQRGQRSGWLVASGALGVATGAIVLAAPFLATLVLSIFLWTMVAVWAIATGVAEILLGLALRRVIDGEWLMVLAGVASVALGVFVGWTLLTTPTGGVIALGWLLGLYASVFGLLLVLLGLRLKRLAEAAEAGI